MKGTLYLIPSPIGDSAINDVIPVGVIQKLSTLKHLVVEEVRTVRRYLSKAGLKESIDSISFYTLNEHTPCSQIMDYVNILLAGEDIGLVSEAGLPAVADPGSRLVEQAHNHDIRVSPLSGPSSLMLALMASGMNGQSFAFNGYIPVKSESRREKIRQLEKISCRSGQSQIIIETPYRNNSLLADILQVCSKDKLLCIAASITSPDEFIRTMTIERWRKEIPDLNKKPCIFIL